MATLNVRIRPEFKRRVRKNLATEARSLSRVVKGLLEEQLRIVESAQLPANTRIPDWVPDGKYVAFVRGAIVAVADTVADAAREAVSRFPDEPCVIDRKRRPIERINYAFIATSLPNCWAYLRVGADTFPVIPATLVGRRAVVGRALPDSAASLSLVRPETLRAAGLRPLGREAVQGLGGTVQRSVYTGQLKIADRSYRARMVETAFPAQLPFDILIGRDVLDRLDVYLLGKRSVICARDP